ncbi:MAG: AAA family ATPase [Spirochaetales bacterium]|nr:AAA family ATPase [Spirochaetales bacterium]
MGNVKIAISGKSGCGNSSVSAIVAEKLGLKMINYTFHNMADEEGICFEEFCKRAENNPEYDYKLDDMQKELAAPGNCVLGSRLAIWLLEDADLKVFLTASSEVRANRILTREGGDLQAQMDKTSARDFRDHNRYKKLYNIDNNDYSFADLIINTENFDQYAVADIIISAITTLKK